MFPTSVLQRHSWDQFFMNVAKECATMGTCVRRQVGCVLVDERRVIIGTGFNGPPHGFPHCRYVESARCPGAGAPSGQGLDQCLALHAEQNALAHCSDKQRIHTCYTTVSPCASVCIKELLQTSCRRIVFLEEYSQPEAKILWTRRPLDVLYPEGMGSAVRTWEKLIGGKAKILGSSTR